MDGRVGVEMEEKKTRVSEWKPEPFVGRTFDGYRIEALIGVGGMGAVYKATQLSLNRIVAVKVLSHALQGDPQFRDRFHREADALSRLSHPNIVTVFDRGEVDTRPYVVMEYVEGTNLRRILEQGPLSPPDALRIVSSVLDALQHAHEAGIVHRDIKPENVLLARGTLVKVADFGLSRLMGPEDVTRLTQTHIVLGTYEYMAPEQREKAKEADERSDLYATGVILYEMLTGELPIGRFKLPSKLRNECSSAVDDLIDRALEKDPAARYQRASEMAGAVSVVLERPSMVDARKTVLSVGAGGERPPPPPVAEPESGVVELPSGYKPQRFENHIHNLVLLNRLLAGVGLLAALWFGGAVAAYYSREGVTHRAPFEQVLGVCGGLLLVSMFLWWTAKRLSRYDEHGRSWQGFLAVVSLVSVLLAPYGVYALWVLYGHRGRAYYDARSRGVHPTAAARLAYRVLEGDSAAELPPRPVRKHSLPALVGAAYVWWLVGLLVGGIVAQTAGSWVFGVWTAVWLGLTALLSGIGLVDCLTKGKPGAPAAAGPLLLCLVTLAVVKLVLGV